MPCPCSFLTVDRPLVQVPHPRSSRRPPSPPPRRGASPRLGSQGRAVQGRVEARQQKRCPGKCSRPHPSQCTETATATDPAAATEGNKLAVPQAVRRPGELNESLVAHIEEEWMSWVSPRYNVCHNNLGTLRETQWLLLLGGVNECV